MDPYAYCNGEFLPLAEARLHVTDLAFLRGYGIFDFFRVVNGHPVFVEDHLDRFEGAAGAMGLLMPLSREALRHLIAELIRLEAVFACWLGQVAHKPRVIWLCRSTHGPGSGVVLYYLAPNPTLPGRGYFVHGHLKQDGDDK